MAHGHSQVSVGAASATTSGGRASVAEAPSWVYVLWRATASTTAASLEREPISSYIN